MGKQNIDRITAAVAVEMFLLAIRVSKGTTRHATAPLPQRGEAAMPWAAPQPTAGPAFQRLHPMIDSDTIRDVGGGQHLDTNLAPNIQI